MRLAASIIRLSQRPLGLTGVNNGAGEPIGLTASISAPTGAATCVGASKLIFINDNRNSAKIFSRESGTVKTPLSLILQPALRCACSHAGEIAITIRYVGTFGSQSRVCFIQK